MIVPVYLFQSNAPEESRGAEDLFKVIATIPATEAFRPLSEGGCPMVRT
jgi:branched-chain amino acid transport system substrate-binding protein